MNEKILATMKSLDVEDWVDIHFGRPVAYWIMRAFACLNIHPNAVSIMSMLIGAASALFFVHGSFFYEGTTGLVYNVIAVLMFYTAYLFDDVDGQLARYTGKCTRLGRMLDGAASAFWYIPIYLVTIYRIYKYHSIEFGWLGIEDTAANVIAATVIVAILVHLSGYLCCMGQQRTADYYNQIYLFFLKGTGGSELDDSAALKSAYDKLGADADWLDRMSQSSYINYTRLQEKKTPQFQRLRAALKEKYGSETNAPQEFRERILAELKPLARENCLLTFNFRTGFMILLYLLDVPFLYFVFEIAVISLIERDVVKKHERICAKYCAELTGK